MSRKLQSDQISQLRKYAGLYAGKGTGIGAATGGVLGGLAGWYASRDEKDELKRYAKIVAAVLIGGAAGATGGYGIDATRSANEFKAKHRDAESRYEGAKSSYEDAKGKYNTAADKYNDLITKTMIKSLYDKTKANGQPLDNRTRYMLVGGLTNLGTPEILEKLD